MCDPSLGAKIKRETLVKMKGAREAYEVSGAEEGGATTRYQFR
ncbi:hypothetical protein PPTG_23309 [Phytophthora nicotianae INRA-310]|uniref:Uncharacterized protein n=1 Tax=Phytophthora nicotianae (strain INRA-310) TaxID=761204 RepID=W2Q0T5_PHYN3|nr:hypothetical protein PPTG_23309 [Phytophthora nicotianae INRA-310]ETN06506.1 hypothetical protein PPTG_23309 [Phytophthora nicotianae INRA-310]